jgi:membrane protein DedA with SNARE-associated domain
MDLNTFLTYALSFSASIKYPLLFVGVIIEGPVLMVMSGFLLHAGVFNPIGLFVTLIAGDLVGDVFWYCVGSRFLLPILDRRGKVFGISKEMFERVKALFDSYHEKILFISKITIGFGMALATLMIAGATKVPFRKYIIINFVGEMVLVVILLSIGFLFGEVSKYFAEGLRIAYFVAMAVVSIMVLYGFAHIMKKKIMK